jgi:hypothetical protein
VDTTTPVAQRADTVEKSAIRKAAIRLVPFVALMFFINYLDRTAIGFAAPNGMNASLGLSAAQFGFRSRVLGLTYFGFIYGLYTLAFFLPTIISGFQTSAGVKFDYIDKGLITAIPYLPAAVALFFTTRHATKHGVKTGHIALPALIGASSSPASPRPPGSP